MPAHTFVWHQGAWARYSDAAQHFFLCWVRPHSAEDAGEDEYLVMWHDTHGTDWVRASDMVPLDKVTSSVYQQIAPEQKQYAKPAVRRLHPHPRIPEPNPHPHPTPPAVGRQEPGGACQEGGGGAAAADREARARLRPAGGKLPWGLERPRRCRKEAARRQRRRPRRRHRQRGRPHRPPRRRYGVPYLKGWFRPSAI